MEGDRKGFLLLVRSSQMCFGSRCGSMFTGVQQYLAVPFNPSTEEARKKKPSLEFVWLFIVFGLVSSMGEVSGL